MRKAIFLDKDGTLVDNSQYPSVIPTDKLLVREIFDGLRYLQEKGYLLIIISNQPWISKKLLTPDQVELIFHNVHAQLRAEKIYLAAHYYCPHQTTDGCHCKKPKPFWIHRAQQEHGLDLSQSYIIGDQEADILAGKNAGVKTILVLTGLGKVYSSSVAPDHIIKNINQVREVL